MKSNVPLNNEKALIELNITLALWFLWLLWFLYKMCSVEISQQSIYDGWNWISLSRVMCPWIIKISSAFSFLVQSCLFFSSTIRRMRRAIVVSPGHQRRRHTLVKFLHASWYLINYWRECIETSHMYSGSTYKVTGQAPKLLLAF